MPLSSLKIVGFKSFADSTTLDFVQGVTGIVGPNGSGKSNITEAVRWAMGEQSAKGLRGERMSDVIFAGTQLRPALNLAEVTLNFDNHDRTLKIDQDLLSITRKIFRSGESEFYINKNACRLKDITNLFLDSGLGKSSFSIISQGQVEAIFNSRPEDRRTIIEETAGVHQYKLQKDTSLQKLDRTTDNLDRVEDIIGEIETRLEPLHAQSSLAKEYVEQKTKYDRLYQTWLVLNIDRKNQTKLKTVAQVTELQKTAEKLQQKRETLATDLNSNRQLQVDTDASLDQQQQNLVTATKDLESLKGSANVSQQQQNQIGDQIKVYQQDLTELTKEQQILVTSYQKLALKDAEIVEKEKKLKVKIETLQLSAGDSKEAIATKLQTQNDAYLDLLQQQAQIRNSIVMLTKQEQRLDYQIEHLQSDIEVKKVAQQKLQQQISEIQNNVQTGQKQYDVLQQKIQKITQQQKALQQTYNQERQNLLQATEVFQRAQAKLASLQELQRSFAGFYQGPKYILKHRAQIAGIQGAVAELITVPEQYQIGIETVLNSQLQNIVVSTEQVAQKAIQMLRQNHQGRATFLPLTSIKQYTVQSGIQQQLQSQTGYLGTAADLVQVPTAFQAVATHLLGTVLVVDTLENGIRIAKLIHRRYRIVTLKGDLLSTSGAMSGGAIAKNGSNLLQQKTQIEAAKDKIAAMDRALKMQQDRVTTQKSQLAQYDETVQKLQAQQQNDHEAYAQTHEQLTQLKNEERYGQRELKTLTYNLETTTQQHVDLQNELTTNQVEKTATVEQLKLTEQQIETLKQALADYDQKQAANSAELNQKLIQDSALVEQVKSSKLQIQSNRSRYETVTNQLHNLQEKITRLKSENTGRVQSKAQLKEQIQTTELAVATANIQVQQLQKKRQELQNAVSQQQQQLTRQIELLENTKTELASNQQQLEWLTQQISDHLTTLETTYHETYQASKEKLAGQKTVDEAEMNQQLKLLKRGLDDIGPVNLNAIDEYSSTKSRYDFLTQQRDDLLLAKETLMATIHELDQEVSQRFEQTFNEVSQAFSEIFPQMFGGGQARLSLTDPEDMLHTGVEIKAQPPGKKLQRLSLLSGGERALTAITVLFSIIKVRPVPFCILDEVEASLDDANVDRYADFLKAYDMKTQFIIITHRKGTMVRANRLYGVTMEESGVSKIVSVSLTDQS